jgi:hypothetical protein
MRACNGKRKTDRAIEAATPNGEAIEITRLEPVILEVVKDNNVSSHLILFTISCKLNFQSEEVLVDGNIKETIYQIEDADFSRR